ncbi:MAG: pilus assembly protein PilP [Sandaracinus sp.]|nr:pilus assembly protein PilP [Sandaracinus sp.]MCB9619291.1 pilus assembly protein PilP [Sandaracinus sp.]
MRTKWSFVVLLAALGCDDPVVVSNNAPTMPTPAPTPNGPAPAAAPVEMASPDAGVAEAIQYGDDVFVEADVQNRDPFRSFAKAFRTRAVVVPQRTVLMPTTAIEEMRLVAIISGVAQPRAMLLDPTGVGHVVKRGDYIGRPEVLQTGGAESMPVTLNWRVARIRSGEVVLTREDPTAPDRPPLTRSLPLYEEGEDPLELRRLALERERDAAEASDEPAEPSARPAPR